MRRWTHRALALALATIACLASGALPARAAGGVLDRSFGKQGLVAAIQRFGPSVGLVVQRGGRIVVADARFAVAGRRPDGSADPTFGRDGVTHADLPAGLDSEAEDVALGPGGETLVAGRVQGHDGERYAIARYTAAGGRDRSFGTDGRVLRTCRPRPFCSSALGIVVQPDGKIVLVVWSGGFLIERLDADGSLDRGFGHGGIVNRREGVCCPIERTGAAIDPAGRIVAVGGGEVVRLLPDGSFDPGFGDHGTRHLPRDVGSTPALRLGPSGGIVAAGEQSSGAWAVVRLTPRGSIDTTFGDHGLTIVPLQCQDIPDDLAVQPDGRIVVAGETFNCAENGKFRAAVVRLTARGRLDRSFSGNGKIIWPVPSTATGVVVQHLPEGDRLVVSGGGPFVLAGYRP